MVRSSVPPSEGNMDAGSPAYTTLSATNLEASWITTLQSEGGPISRPVPARILLAEVKALPEGTEAVELLFKAGTVSVNGRCDIITQDADEFPEIDLPAFEATTHEGNRPASGCPDVGAPSHVGNLTEALKAVMPAVSSDETRYALTGVYFDFASSKLVGTDGFRMHAEDIEPDDLTIKAALIPLKSAKIIAKHGTDAVCWLDEKRVSLPLAGGVFATRVIDGTYPDWKAVKPNPENVITFDPAEFLKIIEGATAIASDRRVSLTAATHEGNMDVGAPPDALLTIQSDGGSGAYKWQMPCASVSTRQGNIEPGTPPHDENVTFTFNPRFLTDAIKSFPREKVTLQVPDSYGACLVNEKAVIMPVRV